MHKVLGSILQSTSRAQLKRQTSICREVGAGGREVSAGGDGQHVLLLCSNLEVTHISVFKTISKGQMRKWNLLSWEPSITGMRKVSAMTRVPCHGK